jgi:uncharacterized membrane protein
VGNVFGVTIRELIEYAVQLIELIAVAVILVSVLWGTFKFLWKSWQSRLKGGPDYYTEYKRALAKPLILGLELLVAADVVNTVTLEASLNNLLGLGVLVLIRTFLGWSLEVETEGRWPWQGESKPEQNRPEAAPKTEE